MILQSKCWNSIINDNYHSTIQSLNKKYIKNNLKTLFSKYVFVLVSLLVIAVVSVFNHCALFSKDRFHSISDCKQMEERKKTKKKESLSNYVQRIIHINCVCLFDRKWLMNSKEIRQSI